MLRAVRNTFYLGHHARATLCCISTETLNTLMLLANYPSDSNSGRYTCVSMATIVMRTRYSVTLYYVMCLALLTPDRIMVTICTTRFNIQQFYVLPTQCIYVFCVDLRTNSDYFPIQH